MPFTIDRDFQVRLPVGLVDYPVRWSDARFNFNTISAWEGHRAGLRSDPPEWALDILTFGDSFTFCWTAWEQCWVETLDIEGGWNVFNAAIPGTGTTAQLNLMKELAPPWKPALVVWAWYNNDLSDNYDLARIRDEVGELPGAPADDPVAPPSGLGQFSALAQLINANVSPPPRLTPFKHYETVLVNGRRLLVHTNEYPYATVIDAYPRTQYGWERGIAAQAEGQDLVKAWGGRLLIVVIPTKEEAYAEFLTEAVGQAYLDQMAISRERLLAECEVRGWLCLDTLPAFREAIRRGQTIYYGFDSHLDSSGNRLLAEMVEAYIAENQFIPKR